MEWRKIKEFPTYSVSDLGQVRNDKRNNLLNVYVTRSGYVMVGLWRDGKHFRKNIHRLIAEAFLPNPENKAEVNHINGDKIDNRVKNLEWVTPRENQLHKCRVLGKKMSTEHMDKIRPLAMGVVQKPVVLVETDTHYRSVAEASRSVGTSRVNIQHCLAGNQKTAGGYHWRYANE